MKIRYINPAQFATGLLAAADRAEARTLRAGTGPQHQEARAEAATLRAVAALVLTSETEADVVQETEPGIDIGGGT